MNQAQTKQGSTYRIRIKEGLLQSSIDWFGEMMAIPQKNGETLLVGHFSDQAALRGFLDQLWNLNFTVLALERIENECPE